MCGQGRKHTRARGDRVTSPTMPNRSRTVESDSARGRGVHSIGLVVNVAVNADDLAGARGHLVGR
jgi:hypothetical protein